MKYEMHFYRYNPKGENLRCVFPIPDKYLQRYSELDKTTTKMLNFWDYRPENHIQTALVEDKEFENDVMQFVFNNNDTVNMAQKFRESFKYESSTFLYKFVDPYHKRTYTRKPIDPNAPPVVRRRRKESGPFTELNFKQLKSRAKKRIDFILKMNTWKNPMSMESERLRGSNEAHGLKILNDMFNTYKQMFEEWLTLNKYNFYINAEQRVKPEQDTRGSAKMFTEYVLVDNTENVGVNSLKKQTWSMLTLAWFANVDTKRSNRFDTYYIINSKRIGIAHGKADYTYRRDIKFLSSIKEIKLKEMVQNRYDSNNKKYGNLVEQFKQINTTIEQNKVEIETLKSFINSKLISLVEPHNVVNSECNFEKEPFQIRFNNDKGRGFITLMALQPKTNEWETLSINVTIMGGGNYAFSTASNAAEFISSVLGNDANALVNICKRATTV